ncbi:MAG: hypothetical protein OCU12_08050 [Methanophagales archaeon]|nr:hypothetical protein [Methanophagales archaeon]
MNEFERKAYYGGRTEVFIRGDALDTTSFDVNSMYPSQCVNHPLPDPTSYMRGKGKTDTFNQLFGSKDMIIECTVEVPYQHVPPLPYRENNKLIFPYGRLTGTWCSPELEYAVKECGCKIVKVGKWMAYDDQTTDLKSYMERWYNERLKWRKSGNKAMETLSKYFLNSLTGKFGEHVRDDQVVNIEDLDMTKEELDQLGKVEYFENQYGVFLHLKAQEFDSTDHTFPVIIAFITSYARIHLHKAIRTVGNDVVYCDTDSVHVLSRSVKRFEDNNWISDRKEDLGAWSNEGRHIFPYYRPKFYGNRLKGINLNRATLVEETDEHKVYTFEKPNKFRESIRRGLTVNKWEMHEKMVSKEDTKRSWNPDGTSKPLEVKS